MLGTKTTFESEIIVQVLRLRGNRHGVETQADGVMDEDPLQRLCDVRRAIYSERDRRLAEAWKAPPKQESSLAILTRDPSFPIERVADDHLYGGNECGWRIGIWIPCCGRRLAGARMPQGRRWNPSARERHTDPISLV